jgi:CheY-like chemotaxis protein
VVVVDDEFDIADALAVVLEEVGFQVVTCSDGREGLDAIRSRRPALVLLDVMMPRMSGIEVLAALRDDPSLSSIPVLLMSAVEPPGKREALGFRSFIRKPFSLDALLTEVDRHVLPEAGASQGGEAR